MDRIFTVEAEGAGDTSRANRSRQVKFLTNENLSDESVARIASWHGKFGHLAFFPEPPKPEDIVDLPEVKGFDHEKSPAQRLRNVLYVLWKQKGEGDADLFYVQYMNRIIDQLKEKLV